MNFTTLETTRLILRKLTPEIYTQLFKHHSDKEIEDILGIKNNADLLKEKAKYKGGLATHNKSFVNFQLILKESNEIIGMCGFHTWYLDHKRAEIGYHLLDELSKSKGYMSEALAVILQYGFEDMDLNRIEAFVGTQNIPSIKLVEKYGFIKEGQLRSHYCKEGIIEDSIVFGLLKHEFNSN